MDTYLNYQIYSNKLELCVVNYVKVVLFSIYVTNFLRI
jgi:hypothetical protein